MTTAENPRALFRQHVNSGMAQIFNLIGAKDEVAGSGSVVVAADGTQYLDCGGYGVFLLGHCHPKIVHAVVDQVRTHPLATHALFEPMVATAAARVSEITPGDLNYVCFTNSGAEAVELGLKVARANNCARIISTEGSFHGKTLGALSVTGKRRYRERFQPLLAATFVPFGDARALAKALADGGAAVVVIEPIQGEGGVRIPATGYLADVRALCDRAGAILVLDEVQTGLGRTGSLWACDAEGVIPDVLLIGKILSGGVVPVGAVATRAALFRPFNRDPLLHSSTYAGNPLAAAAAIATIRAIEDEDIVARVRTLGHVLLDGVATIAERVAPIVQQVRGRGLLIGIEFVSAAVAADVMAEMLRRGVLTSYTLNSHEVLRLTPPVTLAGDEIEWLMAALDGACKVVNGRFLARKGDPSATVHYARARPNQ